MLTLVQPLRSLPKKRSRKLIREIQQRRNFEMKPAHVKLPTYTGELVKVLGTVNIVVKY